MSYFQVCFIQTSIDELCNEVVMAYTILARKFILLCGNLILKKLFGLQL